MLPYLAVSFAFMVVVGMFGQRWGHEYFDSLLAIGAMIALALALKLSELFKPWL